MLARVMAAFVLHGVEDVSCVDDETVLRLTKAIVTYRAAICGSNGAGVRGPYQLRPAPRVSRAWLPEHMRFGRWRSVPMPVAMPKMLAWEVVVGPPRRVGVRIRGIGALGINRVAATLPRNPVCAQRQLIVTVSNTRPRRNVCGVRGHSKSSVPCEVLA